MLRGLHQSTDAQLQSMTAHIESLTSQNQALRVQVQESDAAMRVVARTQFGESQPFLFQLAQAFSSHSSKVLSETVGPTGLKVCFIFS